MSQPSEGLEAVDQGADERTFGVDQAAPRTRNQTISVTIPTMEDDELNDDEDVVKDDVAVPQTDPQEPPHTKDAGASSESSEHAASSTTSSDAGESAASLRVTSPRSWRMQTPAASNAAKRPSTSANNGRTTSAEAARASAQPTPRDDRHDARSEVVEAAAQAQRPVADEGDVSRDGVPHSVSARRAPNAGTESDQMLTAERLLDNRASHTRAPESGIRRILYEASGHLINLGDSKKVRAEKELTLRIAKSFEGSARFVPVLTRKGGVGKTTVSVLLGMALADAREDRVIAVDANPDRGSLHDRVSGSTDYTVRDAIRRRDDISGYTEFSTLIARDETRLDVLASANELTADAAFDDADYTTVAALASQYYSMVLTDSGTGMVHDVMRATLKHADSVVLVSGTSVDEARMTSETISWLEANGHEDLARNAVVVVNNRSASTPLIKLDELEAHFSSRVRAVVRLPYDRALASGAPISFTRLKPATRRAARELAASVVEGLPTQRPSYQ